LKEVCEIEVDGWWRSVLIATAAKKWFRGLESKSIRFQRIETVMQKYVVVSIIGLLKSSKKQ
jgi:hypothetical protein